jgi:putative DNA primase/helicase
MSWVHERSAVHSPILMVTSVERDSGKTTLLGVLGFLIRRSLLSVSVSAAALYRSIEKWQPSFVIDEADAIFRDNELLREVINASWTRGQGVLRCQPETNEPFLFPTFCPKVIGLKGRKLPDTTLNRSIIVELKRKLPTEKVTDFLHIDDAGLTELRRKLARWADDNADRLAAANPVAPEGFINRVAANWRLLLAIAELAGGDWPERARKAAMVLVGPETSLGIKLLSDVRDAFIAEDAEELSTQELVDYLTGLEDRDWSELNRGKPITKVWLSRQLGKFGLASGNVGERGSRLRGWRFDTFTEAFARYLSVTPPANSHTRTQPHEMGTSCENKLAHTETGVRVEKSQKPNNDGLVGECASLQGGSPQGTPLHASPDIAPAAPSAGNGGAFPRVCEHCGGSEQPDNPVQDCSVDGRRLLLHRNCQRDWLHTGESESQ